MDSGKTILTKTTFSTPDRDSNLDFPVIGSLVYCESSTFGHAATEINKAADFLRNPKVYKSARDRQEEFLKSKGLTDDEVQIAFQRANVLIQEDQRIKMLANALVVLNSTAEDGEIEVRISTHPPPHTALAVQSHPNYMFPQPTRWSKFREMGNTAALLAGLAYGLYMFYKKYIQPYLFVRKKRKTAEELVLELKNIVTSSLITLREELRSVHNDLNGVQEQITHESEAVREIQGLKNDIAILKGLLLGKVPDYRSRGPISGSSGCSVRRCLEGYLPIAYWELAALACLVNTTE
uniref:Peroxisomal membrane protein PEX14 n=1 Tax=Timema genevievae TaxID=629358 RepID=A0A7R9PP22_TIMGE|nr:unnamed protein product [Timema genevievae]